MWQRNQQWEIDVMGEFLLDMHLNSVLIARKEWRLQKVVLKQSFSEYLNKNINSKQRLLKVFPSLDVVSLLQRTKFIESSDEFCVKISFNEFDNFSKTLFKKKDAERKKRHTAHNIHDITAELALMNINENANWTKLQYKGTFTQVLQSDFVLSKLGCSICQINLKCYPSLQHHVAFHNCRSQFSFLQKLNMIEKSTFQLTYTIIKKSKDVCFDLGLQKADITIDKIILVAYNGFIDVPYKNGERFQMSLRYFSMDIEYPIIIIFRHAAEKNKIYTEQYHLSIKSEAKKRSVRKWNKIIKLEPYTVPKNLRTTDNKKLMTVLETNFPAVLKNLSAENYFSKLSALLQLEEAYLHELYNHYTMKITFTQDTKDLIQIKLQKNCDLISAGDTAIFRTDPGKKKIYAVVEECEEGLVEIDLKNGRLLKGSYVLIFLPRRDNFLQQYFSLDCLKAKTWFKNVYMFPQSAPSKSADPKSIELYNKSIGQNPEQMAAVQNIVKNGIKSIPYIIWGPPGTGKTTTLVEIIYQLFKNDKHSRILITANSNSACDTIALPLCKIFDKLKIKSSLLMRVYAQSAAKKVNARDPLLIASSNLDDGYFVPSMETLHESRIIICTLSMIGRLNLTIFAQSREYQFSHIFVDEAGAATETETLCAIARTVKDPTRQTLVLAGDPKQLGPVILSTTAKKLGLGVSYMERLLELDCYKSDEAGNYNCAIQTRLCRNFRSHAQIVRLYNHLYYENRLLAKAAPAAVNMAATWHRTLNTEFPIIFHAVYGISENVETSLENLLEQDYVLNYVQDLMYFGINGKKVLETDIGIISPYKKQGDHIKRLLNKRNWKDIDVGSVEIFQGKEKHIIIASFVRSFSLTLGFLEDPQRLNVLLSRAKSLLILIGNPYTLKKNNDFQYVIEQCIEHKTIIGEVNLNEPFGKVEINRMLRTLDDEESRLEKKKNTPQKESSEKDIVVRQKKIGNNAQLPTMLNTKTNSIIIRENNAGSRLKENSSNCCCN